MTADPEGKSEKFASLLSWLGSDEASAAEKYEKIRLRLIRVFSGRGCHEPETLADLTFDRVAEKVSEIVETYTGDPSLFFYGVGNKVHHEWLRKQKREAGFVLLPSQPADTRENEMNCLDSCLERLAPAAREMILGYYRDEKKTRIRSRKRMADALGITMGALQIRASRIRSQLLVCVRQCLAED